jgi:hypothetical protein
MTVLILGVRFVAVSLGLLVLAVSLMEWSGLFSDLTATLNSGEEPASLSSRNRTVRLGLAAAFGVLMASPYRRVKSWLVWAPFAVGISTIAAGTCMMILVAVSDVQTGKDVLLVPTVAIGAASMLGNAWAFAVITLGRYRSPLRPPTVDASCRRRDGDVFPANHGRKATGRIRVSACGRVFRERFPHAEIGIEAEYGDGTERLCFMES